MQHFDLLRGQLINQEAHSGDISARPIETGNKPELHRIGAGREDDGNRQRDGFGRQRGRRACCGNHINLTANHIGRQGLQPIVLALRPAILDCHVLALDEAGFLQTLAHRVHHGRVSRR